MFATPPDTDVVKSLLYELRDRLSSNMEGEAKTISTKLRADSNPQFTMDLLIPNVFVGKSEAVHLTHDDAMSILEFLAIWDPAAYMEPASRSFKTVTKQLVSSPKQVRISDQLLSVLAAQLSGDSTQVASNASEALVAISQKVSQTAEKALLVIGQAWARSWERKDLEKQSATTVCVRCASAMVDLVVLDGNTMERTDLGPIIQMLADRSDPLLQMSALDLMIRLATTLPMHPARAKWLYSEQVLDPLLEMVGGEEYYPDPILGGPALRMLSCLCRLSQQDPSLFTDSSTPLLIAFHRALKNFGSSGELDRLALLDAISSFASASPGALEIVLNDFTIRELWLSLSVAQPKLKSAVLHSVAMVLDPPTSSECENANIPSDAMSMRLYSSIGLANQGDATELVVSLAKSPLIETRIGAYVLLAAVAKRGAGAQTLLTRGGFYEWLISREGETTKEGKEAKYRIVSAVLQSTAKPLLADSIVAGLEKYIQQGPHYVQTQRWDVAMH